MVGRQASWLLLVLLGVAVTVALVAGLGRWGVGSQVLLQRSHFSEGSDRGAVGRAATLAAAESSQGKSKAGVTTLLTKELDQQVESRELHRPRGEDEGVRYANALKKGGLTVDPAAEKTILSAFENSKRGAASLAISNKLQTEVQLAGEYAHDRVSALAQRSPANDKLQLAKAIMAGRSGPTGGVAPERRRAARHTPAAASLPSRPLPSMSQLVRHPATQSAKSDGHTVSKHGVTQPATKEAVIHSKKMSAKRAMKKQPSAKIVRMQAVTEGAAQKSAGVASSITKASSFKSAMQKQLADKAAVIQKKGLAALRSHERESAGENSAPIVHEMAMKPLKGDFAEKMLAKLNRKAKHMAEAAWHNQVTAVTTKDLGTATWPSAKQIEARENDAMAVDTTLQGKGKAGRGADLSVGSAQDATDLAIADPVHMNREQLEQQMEAQLNGKTAAMKQANFVRTVQSFESAKAPEHSETAMVRREASHMAQQGRAVSRSKLEAHLKASIDLVDHSRVERLFHAGLVKEHFDGAKVPH